MPIIRHARLPGVQLILDLHDEEYYGEDLFDQLGNRLVFGTNKKGKTGKELRKAIGAIGNYCHQPLTIGFTINYAGQSRLDVIKQLLGQINRDVKIDLLLMDGGFMAEEIFEYLDIKLILWTIRGRYTKGRHYFGNTKSQTPHSLLHG